jgi:hypothetical protein
LDLRTAQLSNVRQRNGQTEVRVWNAEPDPVTAWIGDVSADLGLGQIKTVAS